MAHGSCFSRVLSVVLVCTSRQPVSLGRLGDDWQSLSAQDPNSYWLYIGGVHHDEHMFCRVKFQLKYWEVRANDHAQARTPANSPWLRERTLDDAGGPQHYPTICDQNLYVILSCDYTVVCEFCVVPQMWLSSLSM